MAKRCPQCRLSNPDDADRCDCGYLFEPRRTYSTHDRDRTDSPAFCPYCGARLAPGGSFCESGIPASPPQPCTGYCASQKNWAVTLILCVFLGGIGAHRFYVGKIGTGLLWLFTLGFVGIGVLVDMILILCGRFLDKNGQPLAQ
jgi:hypothetical protein